MKTTVASLGIVVQLSLLPGMASEMSRKKLIEDGYYKDSIGECQRAAADEYVWVYGEQCNWWGDWEHQLGDADVCWFDGVGLCRMGAVR